MAAQPGTWVFQDGPITYFAASAVPKGVLVVRDTTNTAQVKTAGAAAANVIGVSMKQSGPSGDGTSHTSTNRAGVGPTTSVAISGVVRVTYASAALPGDLLVSAANGQVTKYTAGTSTFDLVVGMCTEVVTSGGVGGMKIL